MPVVPDIDVQRVSPLQENYDNVDRQAERDDQQADARGVGNGGCDAPGDVKIRQIDAGGLNHQVHHVRYLRGEEVKHHADTDQADADEDGGLERCAGFDLKAKGKQENKDG